MQCCRIKLVLTSSWLALVSDFSVWDQFFKCGLIFSGEAEFFRGTRFFRGAGFFRWDWIFRGDWIFQGAGMGLDAWASFENVMVQQKFVTPWNLPFLDSFGTWVFGLFFFVNDTQIMTWHVNSWFHRMRNQFFTVTSKRETKKHVKCIVGLVVSFHAWGSQLEVGISKLKLHLSLSCVKRCGMQDIWKSKSSSWSNQSDANLSHCKVHSVVLLAVLWLIHLQLTINWCSKAVAWMSKVLDDHFFDGFVVSLPKMLIAHEVLSLTGKSSSLQPKGHLCICWTALNKV